MEMLDEVIAIKGKPQGDSGRGVVNIIFTRCTETKNINIPDTTIFKTGSIFISKGYEDIESNYQEGELFSVERYIENDEFSSFVEEHGRYPPNKEDHWTTGAFVRPLKTPLIPVISASLPCKQTGRVIGSAKFPKTDFFILEEDIVYGPFRAHQDGSDTTLTPIQSSAIGNPNHFVAKIPLDEIYNSGVCVEPPKAETHIDATAFIISLRELGTKHRSQLEYIDLATDAQLIAFYQKAGIGNGKTIGKKEAETLKNALDRFNKKNKALEMDERMQRLTTLLDKFITSDDQGTIIIDNYLGSDDGKAFLREYMEKNPNVTNNHIESLKDKRFELESAIKELAIKKQREEESIKLSINNQRKVAEEEIKAIREQTAEQAHQERSKVAANIEQDISDKNNQLETLNEKLQELSSRYIRTKNMGTLEDREVYLEQRCKMLDSMTTGKQDTLSSIHSKPEELARHKVLSDIVLGRHLGQDDDVTEFRLPPMISTKDLEPNAVIQGFVERFDDSGRTFSFDEMANILICVQQSFLTVFKGQPGTGKTSTVIRLADAHNISGSSNGHEDDSFLNVPVSRGWVSGRDFIGFYNTMKGQYQPSKTGMYQFLLKSKDKDAGNSLRIILLDEGNLSPIEHYWSDFLGMCDSEGRDRKIDTGAPGASRYLSADANIRFIATINNDNTTEPLSDRLCNRVPIISMDIPQVACQSEIAAIVIDGAIPFEKLEAMFGRPNELYSDEPMELQSFYNILELREKDLGAHIMVSPRKRLAMHAYYDIAIKYIDSQKAVDFALSQFALPLINGYGKQFRARLDRLYSYAVQNGLSRTADTLEDIISSGDSHVESYSFF